MDMWHRVGRIVRISNLGTLVFFALNISMLIYLFCPNGFYSDNTLLLLSIYVLTVIISLFPIGEWTLVLIAGVHEIKRKDIKIRLISFLEVVFIVNDK